jgi:hypothetical protein
MATSELAPPLAAGGRHLRGDRVKVVWRFSLNKVDVTARFDGLSASELRRVRLAFSGDARYVVQVRAPGSSPVVARASARASFSHVAYAVGCALRCTRCAASLTGMAGQASIFASARKKDSAANWGFRICVGVPHPCEGRCWNNPSESRSPYARLCRRDSCSAAAIPIVTAWWGRPTAPDAAAMMPAFAACARSKP